MDKTKTVAALFDLDGVVLDTETQYTLFWNQQGAHYLGIDDFCASIKGQTLTQIYDKYFVGDLFPYRTEITDQLNRFENSMTYNYIPGVQQFLAELRQQGVKIALVTSSNDKKMQHVYRIYPHFKEQFDIILTGDMFERSKPHPDCFLRAMQLFQLEPQQCVVFEDSLHGLQAGQSSGAYVVGLATTYTRCDIADKASLIIDDFQQINYTQFIELV